MIKIKTLKPIEAENTMRLDGAIDIVARNTVQRGDIDFSEAKKQASNFYFDNNEKFLSELKEIIESEIPDGYEIELIDLDIDEINRMDIQKNVKTQLKAV